MPKLHVLYDPEDKIVTPTEPMARLGGYKFAVLSIRPDLENTDIYNLARKLTEMLMEQL
jgi:hypothetical protein